MSLIISENETFYYKYVSYLSLSLILSFQCNAMQCNACNAMPCHDVLIVLWQGVDVSSNCLRYQRKISCQFFRKGTYVFQFIIILLRSWPEMPIFLRLFLSLLFLIYWFLLKYLIICFKKNCLLINAQWCYIKSQI